MRLFSFLTTLLFIMSTPAFAAVDSTHVGFVDSSLWFDHEPFFSGQEVRVYTTLANSSSADFNGVVEFYDGETTIGNAQVTLERNGGFQVLWADWVPQEGDHTVRVKIAEATLTPPGGEPEVVEYTQEPASLTRFIDTDTDGDGVGNKEDTDDDGDGIPDVDDAEPLIKKVDTSSSDVAENPELVSVKENIEDKSTETLSKIGEFASSTSPKVASAIESTIDAIEEFRETQSKNIDEKLKEVKYKIEEDKAGFENVELGEGEEKKKNDPFNQLQLLALTTAGYTLSHKIVFYIVGVFLLYLILKKVIPGIFGLLRGRGDDY